VLLAKIHHPPRTIAYTSASIVPAFHFSDPAIAAFVLIPLVLLVVLVWGITVVWRRAGATADAAWRAGLVTAAIAGAWMALTWIAGASGILTRWERTPPPFAVLVIALVALSCTLAFGRAGRNLARHAPLWALVAVQSFRLPLELAMHAMYERGIMPGQMSYSGRNFDIVTGSTAIVVALLVASGYGGRRLVAAWNVLGFALLINIVVVAILSTPTFAFFGADRLNTFVTDVPFVWLPAVMVSAALAGHLIIARAVTR
jgi:hypothetical protein